MVSGFLCSETSEGEPSLRFDYGNGSNQGAKDGGWTLLRVAGRSTTTFLTLLDRACLPRKGRLKKIVGMRAFFSFRTINGSVLLCFASFYK